jgi:hypothetical protein
MTKMQTIYEYMMEHDLLKNALEICENKSQREEVIERAKIICKNLDPFISTLQDICKTKEGRESLVENIKNAYEGKNAKL